MYATGTHQTVFTSLTGIREHKTWRPNKNPKECGAMNYTGKQKRQSVVVEGKNSYTLPVMIDNDFSQRQGVENESSTGTATSFNVFGSGVCAIGGACPGSTISQALQKQISFFICKLLGEPLHLKRERGSLFYYWWCHA